MARPRAITMWEFSWIERRWSGAGYEDWPRALDELAERGYDAVRIDAFPHFMAKDPEALWTVLSDEQVGDWGSPAEADIRPGPALVEFLTLCRERGIAVGLSTWFKRDPAGTRMAIASARNHAEVWIATLDYLRAADPALVDDLLFVDLCNEFPNPKWAPFLYGSDERGRMEPLASPRLAAWMTDALARMREVHPDPRYTFSFSDQFEDWDRIDVSAFDLLEPHIWMAHPALSPLAREAGFDFADDPPDFMAFARRAEPLFRSDPERWLGVLREWIGRAADWSRRTRLPLVTTECWAVINWRDWPHADWDWIKEVCEVGVREAAATGRWTAMATSNFCGPQYVGMWRDVAWHRRMTDAIKSAPLDAELQSPKARPDGG